MGVRTSESVGTTFKVPPNMAQWYYCAIVDSQGETDYHDGYATGDEPTEAALQEHMRCNHTWVAGMMYVHDDDAEAVAAVRELECERCDSSYRNRDRQPLDIIEFTVERIPHRA